MRQWTEYTDMNGCKGFFDMKQVEALRGNEEEGTDIQLKSGSGIKAKEPLGFFFDLGEASTEPPRDTVTRHLMPE